MATSRRPSIASLARKARALRLAVFDVDGVMTDGRLYVSASGEETKAFHTHDGHGLKALAQSGVTLAILSGRRSGSVELRARELGIAHVLQGVADKRPAFDALLATLALDRTQACYMGDDVVDLPVLAVAALAFSVPEAPAEVRACAHYVTRRGGGLGAVREVCDLLVRLRSRAARPRDER